MLLIAIMLACKTDPPPPEPATTPPPEVADAGEEAPLPRGFMPERPRYTPTAPDLLPAYDALGEKDADAAIALLTPIVAARPGDAEASYLLGRALVVKQDFEAAVAPLQQAVAANPELALAHKDLAGALLSVRELDQARASIEAYLARVDDDPEGFYMRSFLRRGAGDIEGSMEDAARACDLKMEKACRIVAFLENQQERAARAAAEAEQAEQAEQAEAVTPAP